MTKETDFSAGQYKDAADAGLEFDSKEILSKDAGEEMSLSERMAASYRLMTLLGRDIRTQMHSILGLTEIYMDSAVDDPDHLGDFYGKLLISESLIMDILDDVLEIGNLMREDGRKTKDMVSLYEILANLEDDISPRLGLKGITLSVETEDLAQKEVLVDEQLYYGALLRLTRFLVHNMRKGDSLQILVKEEELREDSFDVVVHFKVNHFGIKQEQIERMLRRYDRLAGEIHRSRDEIDLGIVVMKRYLLALGGSVSCEQTEDGEVIFTVRTRMEIPAFGEERAAVRRGEEKEIPDFSGKKALIIDDDIINLEVGIRLLQNVGFQVKGAAGGMEGLRIYEEEQGDYDVILLDIRMPDLNGLEVARRIRADAVDRAAEVPIIAMSSNATEEDVQLSEAAGIDEHMVKPIDSWGLYKVLKKHLISGSE